MNDKLRKNWDNYTLSWKAESVADKKVLFAKCLDKACAYTDPSITVQGQDELLHYMLEFHKTLPGGHFVTSYFLSYSNKSIARWNMVDENNVVLTDGMSYCEYNDQSLLTSMTGFFDTAE